MADAAVLQHKFEIIEEKRLQRILIVVSIIEITLGLLLYIIPPPEDTSDFFEKIAPERVATLVIKKKEKTITNTGVAQKGVQKAKQKKSSGKKSKSKKSGGGGDAKSRVTAKGVLGLITGKSATMASDFASNILSQGGMAADIDQVLRNVGGLKRAGKSGSGRRGKAGIGYGGFKGGFGAGEGGGLDDLIGGLGGTDALGGLSMKKGRVKISTGVPQLGEGSTGERDMDEIRAVVMERIGGIKYAYNKRLKSNPKLKGKIVVAFVIAASGRITSAKVTQSNMNDSELERQIVRIIKRWTFRKIEVGDVTVVYPFIFAPGS